MTNRRALASLLVLASACARQPARTHHVKMMTTGFTPASLVVAAGDTVEWSNDDIVPHTATARDSTWDSKQIDANGTWRWVAAKPGRHAYFCVFHPVMTGTVDVK